MQTTSSHVESPAGRDTLRQSSISERRSFDRTLIVDLGGQLGRELQASFQESSGDGNLETRLVTSALGREDDAVACLTPDELVREPNRGNSPDRLIVVMQSAPSEEELRVLRCCQTLVKERNVAVCLVSSFKVHCGDAQLQAAESEWQQRFSQATTDRVSIVRIGYLLNRQGKSPCWKLGAVAPLFPLAGSGFRSCFVTPDAICRGIDEVTSTASRQERTHKLRRGIYTILGKNRALREVLRAHAGRGPASRLLTLVAKIFQLLQFHRLFDLAFRGLCLARPSLRRWQVNRFEPDSLAELLALYNRHNVEHVAIAGYNTGVDHFGWQFPGRTVVQTTGAARLVRPYADHVDADGGIVLKQIVSALRERRRELFVLPNYSYVSVGTTFFVPIHGSGSDVSTLGETIERVLLYNPQSDRFERLRKGSPPFREQMYRREYDRLLLRVRLATREQSGYFVRREEYEAPTAQQVWDYLADKRAANIELRKAKATDSGVEVSRYYTSENLASIESSSSAGEESPELLEVPKDSIGRLWDRLEENRLSSWLFHWLVRTIGFHVELFLDEETFPIFWEAHPELPLAKIQLRMVHGDGLPHSPIGDHDVISADLFMKRWQKEPFIKFIREKLPHAKFNPGKHSM